MFECQACHSHDFRLQLQPGMQSRLNWTYTEHDELQIQVANQPAFIADLGFMQRFASCAHCGARKKWAYYFPSVSSDC